jgi:hypothetical protein
MSFTVQCTACRSKFAMPDAVYEQRIAGRVVDIPCKHCRQPIRVDGTLARSAPNSAAASKPASEASARTARSASFGLASIDPPTKPASATPAAAKKPSVRVPLPPGALAANVGSPPAAKTAVKVARAVSVPPKLVAAPTKPASTAPRAAQEPPMDLSGSDLMPLITDKPPVDVERASPPKLPARRPSGERKAASQSGEALAPRPRPARAPGLKATMMGVAPPANPAQIAALGASPPAGPAQIPSAPLAARSGLTPLGVPSERAPRARLAWTRRSPVRG